MKLQNILIAVSFFLTSFSAQSANLILGGGESAIIQANVTTRVSCGQSGGGGFDNGVGNCMQDNANLRVQINQLQNDLYQCRTFSQRPKVWNCVYVCGGNNGMGSSEDKAIACRAAKKDSGVQCSAQCECVQE